MFFEDLKLGMTVDTEPVLITKDKMLRFAREFDHIPLHTDEEYAKNTIFGALIAPGVMSFMAVWDKYLDKTFFGDELIAGKSTKIEWIKPVYADDVLTGKVEISELSRTKRNGLVTVTVDVYNQKGELVLKNVTESVVRCRE